MFELRSEMRTIISPNSIYIRGHFVTRRYYFARHETRGERKQEEILRRRIKLETMRFDCVSRRDNWEKGVEFNEKVILQTRYLQTFLTIYLEACRTPNALVIESDSQFTKVLSNKLKKHFYRAKKFVIAFYITELEITFV